MWRPIHPARGGVDQELFEHEHVSTESTRRGHLRLNADSESASMQPNPATSVRIVRSASHLNPCRSSTCLCKTLCEASCRVGSCSRYAIRCFFRHREEPFSCEPGWATSREVRTSPIVCVLLRDVVTPLSSDTTNAVSIQSSCTEDQP